MTMLDALPSDPKTAITAASMSRLDRILAPLADLGDAIRQEVAASVTPVLAELEATRTQVLGLEARVCLLEARLTAAASAFLGLSVPAAPSGADGEATRGQTENHAAVTSRIADQRGGLPLQRSAAPAAATTVATATTPATKRPRRRAAPRCAACAPAPTLPDRDGSEFGAAELLDAVAVPSAQPTTGDVSMSAMATDGGGPARSEMVDGASSPETPVVEGSVDPELLNTEEPPRVAPMLVSGKGAPVAAAVAPELLGMPDCRPRPSDPPDRARGIISPVLEKGALEMVGAGYYRDLTDLIEEAVFRLLGSDHPGDLEALRRDAPRFQQKPPPI